MSFNYRYVQNKL